MQRDLVIRARSGDHDRRPRRVVHADLAVAFAVPDSSFARAVAPAASMVDSIKFHAP